MKNKNYIGNFIYFILIAILLACGTSLLSNHYTEAQRTFEYSLFYITIIIVIFFGGIGVVLGLSNVNFSVKKIKDFKIAITSPPFLYHFNDSYLGTLRVIR